MKISRVASGPGNYTATLASAFKQRAQDFKAIGAALQLGNIAEAQQAFKAYQEDVQRTQTGSNSRRGNTEVQKLATALHDSDLAGARMAYEKLEKEVQAARGGQRHRFETPPPPPTTPPQSGGNLNVQA